MILWTVFGQSGTYFLDCFWADLDLFSDCVCAVFLWVIEKI